MKTNQEVSIKTLAKCPASFYAPDGTLIFRKSDKTIGIVLRETMLFGQACWDIFSIKTMKTEMSYLLFDDELYTILNCPEE